MVASDRRRTLARRFFEVVPPLLHRVGSEMRGMGDESGPVTMPQFRSMAMLRQGPCSLNELAARHEVTAPTMSRLISTLVERGWVQREPDPADRRQVLLNLTPTGEAMWNTISDRTQAHLATFLADLSGDEMGSLEQALDGLARVLAGGRECRK